MIVKMKLKLTVILFLVSAICLNALCGDDDKNAETVEKQKVLKFKGYGVVVPSSYRDVTMHQPVSMKKPGDKGVNVPDPTESYRFGSGTANSSQGANYSSTVVKKSGDDEDSDSGMWLLPSKGKRSGWGWLADGASAARTSTRGKGDKDQSAAIGALLERDRLMIHGPDQIGGIGNEFGAEGGFPSAGRPTTYRTTILPETTRKSDKWLPGRRKQ